MSQDLANTITYKGVLLSEVPGMAARIAEQEQTIQALRERNAELESPIFREILAERREQDAQWGGPSHDDTHLPFEWCQYIDKFRRYARDSDSASEYEHRLIQIAALAVAAVESSRRLNPIGEVGAFRAKPEVVCPHCDELRSQRDRALSELAEARKRIRTLVDCANARAAIPENGATEAK